MSNTQPGKFLQTINTLLETPPLSSIFHGIFWSTFLIVIAPLVGSGYAIYTVYLVFQYLSSFGKVVDTNGKIINVKESNKELAIIITGCDSGFGLDTSIKLANRGFTVFAGCYSDNNTCQFESNKNIIAFKMDVTDKKDVAFAASKVSSWLNNDVKGCDDRTRVLHGLINNAGTGAPGLIDWNDLSVFRNVMEVNYFAMIQVTKAFLPILKSQSCNGIYFNSRVINIVSVAGLVPLNAPYSGSKYAAEAFSNVLRQELKSFDISVVTLNPSFHKSPLTDRMEPLFLEKIQNLDPELKKQYGEGILSLMNSYTTVDTFLSHFTYHICSDFFNFENTKILLSNYVMWNPVNVINSIVSSIETISPSPQVIVGTDAKYVSMLLNASHLAN